MMLGNLSVPQIEKRLGIEFPAEIKEFMVATRQMAANDIKPGCWHCFDMPFHMVCGDLETATKIYESVKARSSECLEPLRFSVHQN